MPSLTSSFRRHLSHPADCCCGPEELISKFGFSLFADPRIYSSPVVVPFYREAKHPCSAKHDPPLSSPGSAVDTPSRKWGKGLFDPRPACRAMICGPRDDVATSHIADNAWTCAVGSLTTEWGLPETILTVEHRQSNAATCSCSCIPLTLVAFVSRLFVSRFRRHFWALSFGIGILVSLEALFDGGWHDLGCFGL